MLHRAYKNEKDVKYILDNLRPADYHECRIIHGENWKQTVYDSIMQTEFYVLLGKTDNDDTPVCMGGIWEACPETPNIGVAWLLSTPEVSKYAMCLIRELKKEIEKADEKFDFMYNIIYKENFEAQKWLKPFGFVFDNSKAPIPVPLGFEYFYRLKGN